MTGQRADGVIGLDLTGLQELLKAIGPVTVANETITWRNVIDRVHFADVATKGEAGQPALNVFLGQLANNVITAAQTADPVGKLLLLNTLHTLAQQQHLLIYAPGALTSYDGAILQQPGDYLYVVDANSGSAKADLDVNRTITDHVYLAANGTQTSNVTITYANNCGWTYKVFTTTLVPNDAALLNAQYNSPYHLGPLVTYADNLTTISSYVEVPAHSTGNVTYEYALPSTLLPAGVFSHYTLYFQAQPGVTQYHTQHRGDLASRSTTRPRVERRQRDRGKRRRPGRGHLPLKGLYETTYQGNRCSSDSGHTSGHRPARNASNRLDD